MAVSPARVVASADVDGGPDDFEEFYCASVEWDWGDDTKSNNAADCDPYEPGKSSDQAALHRGPCLSHGRRISDPVPA